MKKRAVIFGAGDNFKSCLSSIERFYHIVAIVDNLPSKHGTMINGITILAWSTIGELEYDVVIVTPTDNRSIFKQLESYGVDKSIIYNLGDVFEFNNIFSNLKIQIQIAFFVCGGLGDFIVFSNWLEHLKKRYELESALIDLFFNNDMLAGAKAVFKEGRYINKMYGVDLDTEFVNISDSYDLMMKFSIFPYVQNFFGEKLAYMNAAFLEYVIDLQKFGLLNYNYAFCKSPSYYKTCRKLFNLFSGKNYYSFCDVFDNLGITESFVSSVFIDIDEDEYLQSLGLNDSLYITLNTGENATYIGKGNTRTWPYSNWRRLTQMLKEQYPDIKTVQIGTKTSEFDDISAGINLAGTTNLEQAKALLKNALLHIDYEGGLVHMRHILRGGTSLVLFGSTSIEQHEYSENINLRTNVCPACEWTASDWGFHCPRGFAEPLCMTSITPKMVMNKVANYLESRLGI